MIITDGVIRAENCRGFSIPKKDLHRLDGKCISAYFFGEDNIILNKLLSMIKFTFYGTIFLSFKL